MRSSTDGAWADPTRASWGDAVRDLGHLLRFRASTVRRPVAAAAASLLLLGLTLAFAVLPGRSHGIGGGELRDQLADLIDEATALLEGNLGAAMALFLVLGIGASMGSGGGRELLSRSEVTIHPVSSLTEHLGSMVLMPLNLAWLVQVWGLLAATALVVPDDRLAGAQTVVLLWIAAATAWAQVVGWLIEGVRRTAHGVVVVRVATGVVGVMLVLLHLTGLLAPLATALPTTRLAEAMVGPRWGATALVLLLVAAVGVWAGRVPAAWALGLPPREELRVDSGVHEARQVPEPRWLDADVALLRRLDRGSVWRSVGMRRGLVVLGAGPGLVALVAGLTWSSVMMLPGLAASGAALLFGVNAWCLDGKGMVWRETLPVAPAKVFDARVLVVAECLTAVSAITVLLALLRNGVPPLQVGLSIALCWLVVVVQVLATAMWWSVRSPYSVDLTSPRATPAPHAVMASYAGRLSLVTTLTGLLFASAAALPVWWFPVVLAVAFLLKSAFKMRRARRRWLSAPERARLALTVAAV
ncbi:MAG: hypothetical protein LT071_00360 [Nocardioides sp.]|nr:hypothetical protein [Nocardioides sp.]